VNAAQFARPDPFCSAYDEFLSGNPPGNALNVAGGVGRHAIWLAQRSWRVKLPGYFRSPAFKKSEEKIAKNPPAAGDSGSHFRSLTWTHSHPETCPPTYRRRIERFAVVRPSGARLLTLDRAIARSPLPQRIRRHDRGC